MKKATFMAAVSAFVLMAGVAGAKADTVTTQTTIKQTEIPGTEKINFAALDIDHNGILSRNEVARKLFFIFDTDGNEVIDNKEIKVNKVVTFIPLEKTELTMIDFDDDGKVDTATTSNDQFMEFSMLARFDKNKDGLNAEEFIGKPFLELDTDKSKVIEASEWRDAYIASTSPLSAKQYRYNK